MTQKTASDGHFLSPDAPMGGGVRLGTLITIRWLAILGQLVTCALVELSLGEAFNLTLMLTLWGVSPLYNLWLMSRHSANARLSDLSACRQLAYDGLHLSVLIFLSGGLENPFGIFILAPVTVAASLLHRPFIRVIIGLSCLWVSVQLLTPFPVPGTSLNSSLITINESAAWLALVLTMGFIATYVGRTAREGRLRARGLAATELALEKETQLASLGALAAAAAHELGTPLGTILLVARDRLEDPDLGEETRQDIQMIVDEVQRCRAILDELRRDGAAGSARHFDTHSLENIVREAVAPLAQQDSKTLQIACQSGESPTVARTPGMMHAIRNITANALDFAKNDVVITLSWDDQTALIKILDDGPGFDPAIARRVGEAFLTTRSIKAGQRGGMGLGLFIAKTLIEKEGGTLRIGKAKTGGAWVSIDLDLSRV